MRTTLKHNLAKVLGLLHVLHFLQAAKNIIIGFIIPKVDSKTIPIVINNRNRLTFLKQLVDSLVERGYSNLIVLDNDSTYPALLEYYKSFPGKVIYLHKNLGYKALSKIVLYKEIRRGYYVYTDPDVVPIDECPEDFMQTFYQIMKKHPSIMKVGFSLKIDDLPDCYEKKQKVIDHEAQFWKSEIDDNCYLAQVDTTFALHRPYSKISTFRAKMIRVGYPYELHHLPWYLDSKNLPEEELYYIEHASIGGHWTNGDPAYGMSKK
jgi:hypothetical protein